MADAVPLLASVDTPAEVRKLSADLLALKPKIIGNALLYSRESGAGLQAAGDLLAARSGKR